MIIFCVQQNFPLLTSSSEVDIHGNVQQNLNLSGLNFVLLLLKIGKFMQIIANYAD